MAEPNRYGVRIEEVPSGWRVVILDAGGSLVFERGCADEAECHLYASTVRQHLFWLSEERFRRYYRLPEPQEV